MTFGERNLQGNGPARSTVKPIVVKPQPQAQAQNFQSGLLGPYS